jgi:formate/nitrite transporter FocA (FNT family)
LAEPESPPLDEEEKREIDERSPPRAAVVHGAVAKQGEDELARPAGSLFWSGLAAGLAIMVSVVAEGALRDKLPAAPWREAVADLGYCAGFLIVILGRMQLFTENTLVATLPFAKEPGWRTLSGVARLWTIVFVGNMLGAALAAALAVFGEVQSRELLVSMLAVSRELLDKSFSEALLQAIPAGYLIASLAWIRSAADDSAFWIIIAITYVISLGGFTHIVAGAAEAFLLLFAGEADLGWVLGQFMLPVLIGNVIGGTLLFALLAHAQVKAEI